MAIIQIEAFVTYIKYEWDDKPRYTLDSANMSVVDPAYVTIRQQTFEVEIPDDFDPRPLQIEALRKKQTEVRAEAQAKVTELEEQIQRLLCLEAPRDPEPEVIF